jgi:hypothetical protein
MSLRRPVLPPDVGALVRRVTLRLSQVMANATGAAAAI